MRATSNDETREFEAVLSPTRHWQHFYGWPLERPVRRRSDTAIRFGDDAASALDIGCIGLLLSGASATPSFSGGSRNAWFWRTSALSKIDGGEGGIQTPDSRIRWTGEC